MADEYLTAALYGMKRFNEGASKKVKELMGMEKLIELLNEYIENYGNDAKVREEENYILDTGIEFVYGSRVYLYETIISKKFGFIQWLVENEKIDTTNLQDYWDRWEMGIGVFNNMYKSDLIILTLAIQDNPIEFLVSILK